MINMRNQTVNVNRVDLLAQLRINLLAHQSEYAEAVVDYQAKVKYELTAALQRATNGDFSKVEVDITKPVSHERDYTEIIEMLEVSIDETIELDRESFRAYYKNDWPWKAVFNAVGAMYKTLN